MQSDQDPPTALDQGVASKIARLAELEAATSRLRHDVLGMLSPALLMTEHLLAHSDPKVVRSGQSVAEAIMRVKERLGAAPRAV